MSGPLEVNEFSLAETSEETSELIAEHYETLKNLARAKRRRSNAGQTLLTTDLLHESWMRLKAVGNWKNDTHFLRTIARAMRFVLVDYARQKLTSKRGEGASHINLDEIVDCLPEFQENPQEIVLIDDLLEKLSEINPRAAEVVTLRYFGGFTDLETAGTLNISKRTVRRDWTFAKAWLAAEIMHHS